VSELLKSKGTGGPVPSGEELGNQVSLAAFFYYQRQK